MRVFLILLWMQSQKTINTYDFVCPRDLQWQFRAKIKCPDPNHYQCLDDLWQDERMIEKCFKAEGSRFGYKAVWRKNLDFAECNEGTYMPYSAQSTLVGECPFKKSTCSEEGQVILHDRSPESDAFCMCDYTQGYAFVQIPKNKCYCVPSTEDCSCYKKPCRRDEVVSQDYNCTRSTELLFGKACQTGISKKGSVQVTLQKPYSFSTLIVSDEIEMGNTKKVLFMMWSLIATVILLLIFLMGALFSDKKHGTFVLNSKMQNPKIVCRLQPGGIKDPRILDMCFIKSDKENTLSLVYIDADNNYILKQPVVIAGKPASEHGSPVSEQIPKTNNINRLTFVNDKTVAIIYRKQFDIVLYNVNDLKRRFGVKVDSGNLDYQKYGIQGIVCISPDDSKFGEFIISNKSILYKVKMNPENGVIKAEKFSELDFDTARRFAVSDNRELLFVADEDDKQITVLETNTGTKVDVQESHNRGLQNVRCIAVTDTCIYAATSAGVSVYYHNNGQFNKDKPYKMLIKYTEHVEHTRSLCLKRFETHIYLALSFVKNGKDEITILRFDKNEDFS